MFFILGYVVLNIIGLAFIMQWCFDNSSGPFDADNFFFPLLIEELRDHLNILGITIATIILSILFAPAIIIYFVFLFVLYYPIWFIIIGFVALFGRED